MARSHLKDFKNVTATQWVSRGVNRGFDGTIDYNPANSPTPYELVILPGPVTTQHSNLGLAKQAFRTFLLDKPVVL